MKCDEPNRLPPFHRKKFNLCGEREPRSKHFSISLLLFRFLPLTSSVHWSENHRNRTQWPLGLTQSNISNERLSYSIPTNLSRRIILKVSRLPWQRQTSSRFSRDSPGEFMSRALATHEAIRDVSFVCGIKSNQTKLLNKSKMIYGHINW